MMKNYLSRIVFLLLSITAIISCSKDEDNAAPIVSGLSISKTTAVLFNEALTVHAYANDDDELTYTWETNGGVISGSGKDVSWTAPNQCGKFTITVKVSDGNETVSSSKEVEVVGSYFYDFDSPSPLWSYSSSMNALGSYGRVILTNTSTTSTASFSHIFTDTVSCPISVKTRVAMNFENFTQGSALRTSYYLWFTNPNNGANYLSSVVFHVRPGVRAWEVKAGIHNAETGQNEYQILEANASGLDKIIFSQTGEYHDIGISITQDKTLIIQVDGVELYRSTALSNQNLYPGTFKVNKFSYYLDSTLKTQVDNFCYATDGTILK